MRLVDEFKIELPDDFPADLYSAYWTSVREVLLPDKGPPWQEFAGASNLIGWRFRSCFEAFDAYAESWLKFGTDVKHEEIYQRERNLFTMFVSGVSTVESTIYSLYALASHSDVLGLPFGPKEQRRASPQSFREALTDVPGAEAMSSTLDALLAAQEWKTWLSYRNRMAHRSNLPRKIQASVGSAAPPKTVLEFVATSSTESFVGDEGDLAHLYNWLAHRLADLLASGTDLARGTRGK